MKLHVKTAREMRPGDSGLLYTGHADGAWPNGSRIEKCNDGPGDLHKAGDRGTICGSVGPRDWHGLKDIYGYCILWDDNSIPIWITGNRIRLVTA